MLIKNEQYSPKDFKTLSISSAKLPLEILSVLSKLSLYKSFVIRAGLARSYYTNSDDLVLSDIDGWMSEDDLYNLVNLPFTIHWIAFKNLGYTQIPTLTIFIPEQTNFYKIEIKIGNSIHYTEGEINHLKLKFITEERLIEDIILKIIEGAQRQLTLDKIRKHVLSLLRLNLIKIKKILSLEPLKTSMLDALTMLASFKEINLKINELMGAVYD